MKLITVHGIRTNGIWARRLEEIEAFSNANVNFLHFNYGYFNLARFCFSPARNAILKSFFDFYTDNIQLGERPSLIAHSFGTWIVTTAIKVYPSIRFEKIIFFGSILNPEINLDVFFKKDQVRMIRHEVGSKDKIVPLSRIAIGKDAGKSGQVGFSTIPYKYKSRMQEEVFEQFLHSSASEFKPHMEENWVTFLLPQPFEVDKKILRDDALKWIDYIVPEGVSFSEKVFQCRVDRLGNYYARYTLTLRNNSDRIIDRIPISISADSTDELEDMQFLAMDDNRTRLQHKITIDEPHHWRIDVHIAPLAPGHSYVVRYKFKASKTMRRLGDFDHFHIRNTVDFTVEFRSFYRLIAPIFFTIRDSRLTNRLPAKEEKREDNTYKYSLSHSNPNYSDGIIFYYEGYDNSDKLVEKYAFPTNYIYTFEEKDYIIRNARENDLAKIQGLELDIDRENRALGGTLIERLRMFSDGFLVAEDNGKIVGYIQSLIWNQRQFETFEDIKDFPLHHDLDGKELYAIFLAVSKSYRKRGVGGQLLSALEKIAKSYRVEQISLVAKSGLLKFYEKHGYYTSHRLPNFLRNSNDSVDGYAMIKSI